ncbi:MAG TPA: NAD-dependent epimerase/dehydratase family protein [Burkholderiales bacterium]|nr:NAD-dependent epimerase/dehydratase family protein [Burkholderiales bacterium]
MRVLLTGGAGFIGSHTAEALLEAGADVVIFDNFSAGRRNNLPRHARLRVVEGDLRERDAVAAAMDGCTHVLNLAAQISVPLSIEQPGNSAHHNVAGFANVLDCARHAGVERVVFASSAAVYGQPQAVPLTEESPTRPMSPYGLEKLVNEQQAALFERLFGLSAVGLRYFNVYGPRQDPASQYAGVISRFASRLLADEPLTVFGDGLQTRDFVFVKDVARVNVRALTSRETGYCNVGTGRSVTLLELIDALAACAGRTPQITFGPPAVGDIRESAMTPQRMRGWFGGFETVSLTAGLAALLEWMRAA